MYKYIFLFLSFPASAQFYTPVRAAIGAEIFGTSPQVQAYAEALFNYRKKSFLSVQAGLGRVAKTDFFSFSLSSALTYSYLLNPYRRKSCVPQPGYNTFETYLEGGLASFYVDTYDNSHYMGNRYAQRLITPLALAGLRFHIVTGKWIYILKIRCTPAFSENKLASKAGVVLALGWR
jgi:hypothetical protein